MHAFDTMIYYREVTVVELYSQLFITNMQLSSFASSSKMNSSKIHSIQANFTLQVHMPSYIPLAINASVSAA